MPADALEQAPEVVFEDDLTWKVTGDRTTDLPEACVTAHWIAKEAMVNACKHAGATQATIAFPPAWTGCR